MAEFVCIPITGWMKDLTGKVFGRLTVVGFLGRKGPHYRWLCRCECGTETCAVASELKSGHTKSCGCYRREALSLASRTHGLSRHPLAKVLKMMKQRCYNRDNKAYHRYGGRGIYICDRWLGPNGLVNLINDMGEQPPGTSIERKDNDGPYSPDNCVWATDIEQGSNKRNNILLTWNGETHTAAEWSRRTGIHTGTIRRRKHEGWSDEEALTAPPWGIYHGSQINS